MMLIILIISLFLFDILCGVGVFSFGVVIIEVFIAQSKWIAFDFRLGNFLCNISRGTWLKTSFHQLIEFFQAMYLCWKK